MHKKKRVEKKVELLVLNPALHTVKTRLDSNFNTIATGVKLSGAYQFYYLVSAYV
jgi:hypothetical protein